MTRKTYHSNSLGEHDPRIRIETLKLAAPDDLNTEEDGRVVKHLGKAVWWETGKNLGDHTIKFHLTGDEHQTEFVKKYLGTRIYVIRDFGEPTYPPVEGVKVEPNTRIGIPEKEVDLSTLKLATRDDLNRTLPDGTLQKAYGITYWIEYGNILGDDLLRYTLTENKTDACIVRALLGERVYVIK